MRIVLTVLIGLVVAERAVPLPSVRVEDVPHVKQRPDFCGEACVEMVLRSLGKTMDQDDVFAFSGLDPTPGRGCHAKELVVALRRIGFRPGDVWFPVDPAKRTVLAQWEALHRDLTAGLPSIVCMRYDESAGATEHFRLVVGYDAAEDEILYHEPAAKDAAYRRMPRKTFLSLWPIGPRGAAGTVLRMRLLHGELAKPIPLPPRDKFSPADYAQHILALRKKLPHAGFTIVLQKPFVVVGDESEARVRWRARSTVKWAADRLRQAFFQEDPKHILDVWLFRDKESYEANALALFGSRPHTPYGYYSAHHRALVMNIATGGGTLVHEIVHPFVEANVPGCPPWLNEGLGSLYEQCDDRDGKIVGLTNWRLSGLQASIRSGGLPAFEELTAMDAAQFYGSRRGDNYAQSRYLLYYLQEKGRLRSYYRAFLEARKDDPTGLATLREILGEQDLRAFQTRWEAWVLTLRFP